MVVICDAVKPIESKRSRNSNPNCWSTGKVHNYKTIRKKDPIIQHAINVQTAWTNSRAPESMIGALWFVIVLQVFICLNRLTFEHPAAITTTQPQPPSGATKFGPKSHLFLLLGFSAFDAEWLFVWCCAAIGFCVSLDFLSLALIVTNDNWYSSRR